MAKDKDLMQEDNGEREKQRDWIFGAGQSRRIWSELYKVIDASDVIIQVREDEIELFPSLPIHFLSFQLAFSLDLVVSSFSFPLLSTSLWK